MAAKGVRRSKRGFFLFSTTSIQALSSRKSCSISASGISCLSLIVSAWECERIAPMRTQMPSMESGDRVVKFCWFRRSPSTLRVFDPPQRGDQSTESASRQEGRQIHLWEVRYLEERRSPHRSISRIAELGSASSLAALCCSAPI